MAYLIIGEDMEVRDRTIREILHETLPAPDALKFDYDLLDGARVDPAELKKSLMSLPAVASRRLVVIRDSHKLKNPQKDIISAFLSGRPAHCVVVLEMLSARGQDAFIRKIRPYVKTSESAAGAKTNVFDMTRAIGSRRPAEALKLLRAMLDEGVHPLQIMGGVVWFWGKTKTRLAADRYLEGLQALKEADLNIKRSRLPADHAVEVLVTKLGAILG